MATADIFSGRLQSTNDANSNLDIQVQTYIRDNFWPGSTTSLLEYVPYFRYFQWTIDTILWPNAATEKALYAVQTYQDLVVIIQCMNKHGNESRIEIAARLRTYFPQSSRDCILRSMDLTVRLWMTLHVRSGDVPIGPLLSNMTAVGWKPKQSLHNMVAATFPRCRKNQALPASHASHIDPSFTVMNIRKLCRIQIHCTQTLHDHLKFDRSTKRLYIYPHKVCLLNHLKCTSVYPSELLIETIRTLDLLFPYGDRNTERWLEESNQPFYRTSSSHIEARASSLEEFQYWRLRLVELYHIFEQPPATVLQMWHDRRNPMQWYTFWLAALIAVLSIVFGSLGTYIGFKQIQLAEESIRISRAQAK